MRIVPLMLVLCFLIGASQAQFIQQKTFALATGTLQDRFLAKGDFNRDGKLDVLLPGMSASSQPELVVFPGNGAGGFVAPIITPITANQAGIYIAGDVNGDGIPDVVITAMDSITGVPQLGVMLADGTGKFKAPVLFDANANRGVALGDFNGDGKMDLALGGSPLTVLPGKGDGTFGSPVSSAFAFNLGIGCAATADFNKDNKLDLVASGGVLLGNGDGTFQSPLIIKNAYCDIAVGDFNKDGFPDLVSVATGGRNLVQVLLGDGTGHFNKGTIYRPGENAGVWGFVVDDFNGDNNLDIAVANSSSGDVTLLMGKGNGTFTFGKSYAVAGSILSGDFNGDHKADLAVTTLQGFGVFLGRGNGTMVANVAQNDHPAGAIHLADFNGDGKVDEIEFGVSIGLGAVFLGRGDGTFGSRILLPNSCQASNGVVVDLNGDKKPDLAFAKGSGGGVAVCIGNGDGTFKDAVIYDAGVQHGQVVFGDFNHDGKMDLAASDIGGVSVLLGNGDGTFQTAIPSAAGNFVNLVTGDFNHDGKLDIAANSNHEITVLLGKGDGTFRAAVTSPNSNGVGTPAAGDLNKDGNLDLVTATQGGSDGLNILFGNGDGTFKAPTLLNIPGPSAFQIRDLNGDGKLDLIVAVPSSLEVMLGNGDGTFQPAKSFLAPGNLAALGVADLNGDGLLDVAYLQQSSAPGAATLVLFLNQGH